MITEVKHEEDFLLVKTLIDGKEIEVEIEDKLIKFVDGYASICFGIEEYSFYTSGVIDENYNIVIPFYVYNDGLRYITTFKNKKVIYHVIEKTGDEKDYLIDVLNTKFDVVNGIYRPLNYLLVFDDYDVINDRWAMVLKDKKFVLLDVSNAQFTKLTLDYATDSDGKTAYGLHAVYEMGKPFVEVICRIDPDGNIKKFVDVGELRVWFNDNFLDDTEKLREEAGKLYKDIKDDGGRCKILN